MGRPTILAYHAVSPFPNPLCVDVASLREQLTVMVGKGMHAVTFAEALSSSAPDRAFAVTFDDGFLSVYDRARPVLAELGIPATVFVPTARIGRDEPLDWPGLTPEPMPSEELLPMTWDQVRELAADGWEIGSHSVTHPRLPQMADADLRRELVDSKRTCEEQAGVPCRTLAYPFGDADARVVGAAAEAGYVAGVTMTVLRCAGPLAVPRIGVYSNDTRRRFALKVSRPLRTSTAMTALSTLHGAR